MVADEALRLLVIGGGATGAALAVHAIAASRGRLHIDLVEPAADLGRGIAYATPDPVHRINVPSARMSLFPDRPDHLTDWLFARGILPDASATDADGHHYVARSAFGAYCGAVLAETVAAASGRVSLRHYATRATAVGRDGTAWGATLAAGGSLSADRLALCCGHAEPVPPCAVPPEVASHPGFVGNPWRPQAFARIGAQDAVLVVGTGLTMADVLASLVHAGHRGPVTAISRRALVARPQGQFVDGIDLFEGAPLPHNALTLLRALRRAVAARAPAVGWQPVADALRAHLPEIWSGLPVAEKRKVIGRLLPFWEVHRFRMAPQPHAVLDELRAEGRLTVIRAGLAGLAVAAGGLLASLAGREGIRERRFDAVVLCTGPGPALRSGGLVADLLARGLARPDAVEAGLATDSRSRLLDAAGRPHADAWAFGPLTRGTFGEMTGAPDIVKHIARVVPDLFADADGMAGAA